MSKYSPVTDDIAEAARIIKQGRVVAVPTGTSYGLAADALQGHAIGRVRALKHRPEEKTLTVFMAHELLDLFVLFTDAEEAFWKAHTNDPITLLMTPTKPLEHLAQDGRIGLRMIDHPIMQALAEKTQVPLTATSANVSGEEPCVDIACIETAFPGKIDETTYDLSLGCIVNGGSLPAGRMSTIIRFDDTSPKVVRQGAFAL